MNQIFATRLHAIEATPARWRAPGGLRPTHWLIYAQAATRGDCAELRELIAEGAEVTTGGRTCVEIKSRTPHAIDATSPP